MTGFDLPSDRRRELAALLADGIRFGAEYPSAADYLTVAPRLGGSGDESADRDFDLRMLHYLAGGDSANPYWDVVAPAVTERNGRRVVTGGAPTGSARLGYAQTVLQAAYAYAIPAPETLAWVAAVCAGRPVLEIGAGRGYWAHQLTRQGLHVVAVDSQPPQWQDNPSFPAVSGLPVSWHPIAHPDELPGEWHSSESSESGDRLPDARGGILPESRGTGPAESQVGGPAEWRGSVLLLCWPPGWGSPMASRALARFAAAGGADVVYIGEPRGGRTGDDAFFEMLGTGWELTGADPDFVSWWNLSDRAEHWTVRPLA
ncbi:SAM-dependent methyltransferase [Nocardia sp. alder85J]|uniref:SAM-dependent methyltransferase n=1 Tax=Nocardia sp. alder85J TaxID=2862949 RepID=UPI001CD74AF4|nr:SAM-dependent methyltransferase [Nocardia sp. alder85J]MCX4091879.1 SAM-dependent methyltransferase [Nocardia sp. alder85J]